MVKKGEIRVPTFAETVIKEEILKLLCGGWSLTKISKLPGMPERSTISGWAVDDDAGDDFCARYARARRQGWEVWADEIKDISDEPHFGEVTTVKNSEKDGKTTEIKKVDMIEHRKLQVDSRKFMLAKMVPKIYGDKTQVEVAGVDGKPIQTATVAQVVSVDAATAAAEYQKMLGGK